MTFWEFFNNHEFIGFIFAAMVVFMAAATAEALIVHGFGFLRAKYAPNVPIECDCEPCDCPPGCHDDAAEDEDQ